MIEQRPLRPDEIARILAVDTTFHVHLRRGPHDVQNESFPTLLLARQRLLQAGGLTTSHKVSWRKDLLQACVN